MSATFTTSNGTKGRTGSSRRFIVVHVFARAGIEPRVVIDYRTDDEGRAKQYVRTNSVVGQFPFYEVIDTRPVQGKPVVIFPAAAVAAVQGPRPATWVEHTTTNTRRWS